MESSSQAVFVPLFPCKTLNKTHVHFFEEIYSSSYKLHLHWTKKKTANMCDNYNYEQNRKKYQTAFYKEKSFHF